MFNLHGYTETYTLAARVKHKLTNEAVSTNVDLRKLVCQANLLDTLIETLNSKMGNVSFDSICSHDMFHHTSDDSDFDESESMSDYTDDSDLSEDEEDLDDIVEHFGTEHQTQFSYISSSINLLNIHAGEYSENVEEVLSSDSETGSESEDNLIEYEDYDQTHGISLSRMVSNACGLHREDTNETKDDDDQDQESDEDLLSLSNCSSLSSVEDTTVVDLLHTKDIMKLKEEIPNPPFLLLQQYPNQLE